MASKTLKDTLLELGFLLSSTAGGNYLSTLNPTWTGTLSGVLAKFLDSNLSIYGSDNTKIAKFSVTSLTTATTRTFTLPNITAQLNHVAVVSTIATDVAFTLTPLSSSGVIEHTGTLTADRVVTLSTTGAYNGATFKITRTGTGAFNLDIGGLKSLVPNTWCEVTYNGTAWRLTQYGAL